jgi:hypothetical protein
MRVVYHPKVQQDVSRILRYYDAIDPRLGDQFWEELKYFLSLASETPLLGGNASASCEPVPLPVPFPLP